MSTTFMYFSAAGTLKDKFLQMATISVDGTRSLTPQITDYDFWGHPIALQDPNGKFTCDTYDSARGFLSSRRRVMAEPQSSCSSSSMNDITTSWHRDSWLRLTQLTRPDTSCVFYTYTTTGQLSQIKRVDSVAGECGSGWAGDNEQFVYTPDGQVSEVDTYDSSNNPTAKQPFTYFASRRLQEIVNPVDTSKFTGLVYDSAGKLTEVDGAGSLSKTVEHYAGAPGRDGRVTSVDKYKTSSTFDTWSLLYAWLGDQLQVTDGDNKVTGSTRDDLSRLVKISSPDLGAPTVNVFDAGSRLSTRVDDLGGASQMTHLFTYDFLNRQTVADYDSTHRCAPQGGSNHANTTRAFDALPAGVGCPVGMINCTNGVLKNAIGRLAYVETVLMCSTSYSDGSLDQRTYFAYDDAGRVIEEFIADDSGRTADESYTYTSNGSLQQVNTPSNLAIQWSYGGVGASDADVVTAIVVAGSNAIDSVQWFPFGPWKQYRWEATIGGTNLQNRVTRNLAYRITGVYGAEKTDLSSVNAQVAIVEDAMGRVNSRVFSPAVTGLQNSYFTYDEQSRVLCESAVSGACPTSGANLKNNHNLSPPFLNAGDWKQILRPIAGTNPVGYTNNFNTSGTAYGTSHQVTDVNQTDGTPKFQHTTFAYNALGERVSDDNTTKLNNDARTYSYDGRHNVTNVRGQYFTGGVWHFYDVGSGFDAKNRRVYKSFLDETTGKTATWFFYYDAIDRLTEIRYTPDISVPGTFSVFDLIWLKDKLVLYWQVDWVNSVVSATSKRYVTSDEADRPMQLWNWPSSGDATRVWAINPSAWGLDTNILGGGVFQPVLFAGQYRDTETAAYENDGVTVHRPGIALNGFRSYDSFTGGYLQFDSLADRTWSTYLYVHSNPVGTKDKNGLDDSDDSTGLPHGHWACTVLGDQKSQGLETITVACGFVPDPDGSDFVGGNDGPGIWVPPGGGGGGGGGGGWGGGVEGPAGEGYAHIDCDGKTPVSPPNPAGPWGCQITCLEEPDDVCTSDHADSTPKTGAGAWAYDTKQDAYRQAIYNACQKKRAGCELVTCTSQDAACSKGPPPQKHSAFLGSY